MFEDTQSEFRTQVSVAALQESSGGASVHKIFLLIGDARIVLVVYIETTVPTSYCNR